MNKAVRASCQPDQRQAALAARRNRKMAASANAYVRGSTTRFYAWLGQSDRCTVPDGPEVWICGDCHVGNLGPVASADGELEIQIRDLDQTVIGNPAHDLIRLGLSLAMAARGSDLPGVTTAHVLEHMMEGYAAAFTQPDGAGDGHTDMPKAVRLVMRKAAGRSWRNLADERIEGVAPVIPLGRRFWPLEPSERAAIDALFGTEELRALATALRGRDDGADVRVVDAAYWRKGCSSLGQLRFAVLVAVEGRKGRLRHCLMDIKEAIAAAAPRYADSGMPRDNARRVVEGARNLSPFLGERMVAARLLDRAVFVRELLPQDLKLQIEQLTREEAVEVARFLTTVVGRAHARQMDPATGASWLAELQRNSSRSLDAPSWLWSSIVELVGAHEQAYLEHCRRYAMETDAA
ncbi:DUF2252 domain-containing protein [Limobrevibacterium gyesilva]|uniref:DUF2252 domain-containing protein n=1 Tax=Limobrevibacterium gyesilva TaxID=2991712 RepID=A0AA41YKE2_9PROT|nr:DUF2252 domain-containing protein [Limobrevibacterium gyesilva]MCW3473473.1 DUF2252 domain-containing protein [Limobrevibacterium gyesilva]